MSADVGFQKFPFSARTSLENMTKMLAIIERGAYAAGVRNAH